MSGLFKDNCAEYYHQEVATNGCSEAYIVKVYSSRTAVLATTELRTPTALFPCEGLTRVG